MLMQPYLLLISYNKNFSSVKDPVNDIHKTVKKSYVII